MMLKFKNNPRLMKTLLLVVVVFSILIPAGYFSIIFLAKNFDGDSDSNNSTTAEEESEILLQYEGITECSSDSVVKPELNAFFAQTGVALSARIIEGEGKIVDFEVVPSLPKGLVFDQARYNISGVPEESKDPTIYNLTVVVSKPAEECYTGWQFLLGVTGSNATEQTGWEVQKFWGGRGNEPGKFTIMYGMEVVGDQLYVTDCRRPVIARYSLEGELDLEVGSSGSGAGQLSLPADIKQHPVTGDLYVVEEKNHRIQVFDQELSPQAAFGLRAYAKDFSEQRPFFWDNPLSLAFGADGRMYVTDYGNHRVQIYDKNLELVSWIGADKGEPGIAPGEFNSAYYMEVNKEGNLFVVDRLNNRIQEFSADGQPLRIWGNPNREASDALGEFNYPHEIAIDKTGKLYIADTYNKRVQIIDPRDDTIQVLGGPGVFVMPKTVAVDDDFNIYVGDVTPGTITKWAPVAN